MDPELKAEFKRCAGTFVALGLGIFEAWHLFLIASFHVFAFPSLIVLIFTIVLLVLEIKLHSTKGHALLRLVFWALWFFFAVAMFIVYLAVVGGIGQYCHMHPCPAGLETVALEVLWLVYIIPYFICMSATGTVAVFTIQEFRNPESLQPTSV
eukprot:TRINITY_DN2213_c0_g1_i1.p1 TRINITY_DN2213_c0_g1~~TRINITY_DN2213_c0_g1_i1.p1  ORF type:complete len:153 (+),score=34.13 TRINITY_DN2213_c0_g1_i1:69-527(+)